MGAWGSGPLENDNASEYADGVADGTDLSPVERALDKVVKAKVNYVAASDGAEALAACEIIARLLGHQGETTPRDSKIDEWIESIKLAPSSELIEKAQAAISRVMTERSELKLLWMDSNDFDAWKHAVEDLAQRLTP
jgi:hypothetical protein